MFKKIAIVVAVLLLIGAGVTAWLWNQATALPDWYTPGTTDGAEEVPQDASGGEQQAAPQWLAFDQEGDRLPDEDIVVPLPSDLPTTAPTTEHPEAATPQPPAPKRKRTKGKAKRHEMRGFHRRARKKKKSKGKSKAQSKGNSDGGKRPKAVKASRAVYEDGHLEIGMIVDLSNVPRDKLSKKDRRRYDRAVANFPGLTKRDVWVGVEDEPVAVDGFLQLGPNAQVRVGKLRYSLSGAATRLGMKPAQLRSELNRELRRLGFVDPATQ